MVVNGYKRRKAKKSLERSLSVQPPPISSTSTLSRQKYNTVGRNWSPCFRANNYIYTRREREKRSRSVGCSCPTNCRRSAENREIPATRFRYERVSNSDILIRSPCALEIVYLHVYRFGANRHVSEGPLNTVKILRRKHLRRIMGQSADARFYKQFACLLYARRVRRFCYERRGTTRERANDRTSDRLPRRGTDSFFFFEKKKKKIKESTIRRVESPRAVADPRHA